MSTNVRKDLTVAIVTPLVRILQARIGVPATHNTLGTD